MSLLNNIKGWWNRLLNTIIKREFGVKGIESNNMRDAIKLWIDVYQGNAPWIDQDQDIKTIKFAKHLCTEVARLTTLAIDVQFDGSRKDYMQKFFDKSVKPKLREWVEYGTAFGTIILKPNGIGVDLVTPDSFEVITKDGNGRITGIVFKDSYEDNERFYTKLEYHRFMTATVKQLNSDEYKEMTYYTITNRAFESKNSSDLGSRVELANTKWSKLKDEVNLVKANDEKIDSMLFGVLKMPFANDIDFGSPLGLSIFANAIEELRDLDVAYSRNSTEIEDSRKMVLLDERLVQLPSIKDSDGKIRRQKLRLPKFIKNVNSDDPTSFYQEINPTLNTSIRKEGIDNLLSLVGCKCGFSNGYFVLDQKTGMVTATQVEADDRGTIQLIKDIRDRLECCLDELFYAQSVFADLYNLAPAGEYEINYDFGDITFNAEEEKSRWWSYVQAGKVPAWMYFVKFEGMSEADAKSMVEEATPKEQGLFDE